jgi:hypothetical protein
MRRVDFDSTAVLGRSCLDIVADACRLDGGRMPWGG